MPDVACDALLDRPRIRPHLQHIAIVIRFDQHQCAPAQSLRHQLSNVAEISYDSNFYSFGFNRERESVDAIVRYRERMKVQRTNLKRLAGSNLLAPLNLLAVFGKVADHARSFGHVDWHFGGR